MRMTLSRQHRAHDVQGIGAARRRALRGGTEHGLYASQSIHCGGDRFGVGVGVAGEKKKKMKKHKERKRKGESSPPRHLPRKPCVGTWDRTRHAPRSCETPPAPRTGWRCTASKGTTLERCRPTARAPLLPSGWWWRTAGAAIFPAPTSPPPPPAARPRDPTSTTGTRTAAHGLHPDLHILMTSRGATARAHTPAKAPAIACVKRAETLLRFLILLLLLPLPPCVLSRLSAAAAAAAAAAATATPDLVEDDEDDDAVPAVAACGVSPTKPDPDATPAAVPSANRPSLRLLDPGTSSGDGRGKGLNAAPPPM